MTRRGFLGLLASVPAAVSLRVQHQHYFLWYPQLHRWGCPGCRRLVTMEELADNGWA